MITESYSASCFVSHKDGKYVVECDIQSGDKYAESEYQGESLTEGLNQVIEDLTGQMKEEPEETLEEKVARLEAENKRLQEIVDRNGAKLTTQPVTHSKLYENLLKELYNDRGYLG